MSDQSPHAGPFPVGILQPSFLILLSSVVVSPQIPLFVSPFVFLLHPRFSSSLSDSVSLLIRVSVACSVLTLGACGGDGGGVLSEESSSISRLEEEGVGRCTFSFLDFFVCGTLSRFLLNPARTGGALGLGLASSSLLSASSSHCL